MATQLVDQLVEQHVDGGVHGGLGGLGVQGGAGDTERGVRPVLQLVHGEHHGEADQLVIEALEAVDLGFDVGTQRGGDFDLLAAELELHGTPPLLVLAAFRGGMDAPRTECRGASSIILHYE